MLLTVYYIVVYPLIVSIICVDLAVLYVLLSTPILELIIIQDLLLVTHERDLDLNLLLHNKFTMNIHACLSLIFAQRL